MLDLLIQPCQTSSYLHINILPVLFQDSPCPGADGFTIQAVSDLFLQLLIELLQSVNFIAVFQEARIEALEAKLVASISGLGHHRNTAASKAMHKHAADAQSSAGHACTQVACSSGGSHAYKHSPRCRGACCTHTAHTAGPLGSSLAQEGGSASWQRHSCPDAY